MERTLDDVIAILQGRLLEVLQDAFFLRLETRDTQTRTR